MLAFGVTQLSPYNTALLCSPKPLSNLPLASVLYSVVLDEKPSREDFTGHVVQLATGLWQLCGLHILAKGLLCTILPC